MTFTQRSTESSGSRSTHAPMVQQMGSREAGRGIEFIAILRMDTVSEIGFGKQKRRGLRFTSYQLEQIPAGGMNWQ